MTGLNADVREHLEQYRRAISLYNSRPSAGHASRIHDARRALVAAVSRQYDQETSLPRMWRWRNFWAVKTLPDVTVYVNTEKEALDLMRRTKESKAG